MKNTATIHWRPLLFSSLLSLVLTGCASNSERRVPTWGKQLGVQEGHAETIATPGPARQDNPQQDTTPRDNSFYLPGNGRLFATPRIADARIQEGGDIKLNFQNASLQEVVSVILGDMLGSSYVIDPQVKGQVTMQTSKALRKQDLVPTLELLLRMNDAALIDAGSTYRVVPLGKALTAVRAPQLGDSGLALPPGYSVRIVPLGYVSADEMAQILDPFVSGSNQLVRVDTQRNLLILAASGGDMDRLLETIRVFDVDRMRGMSVAMFTPDFVDAKTLAGELEQVLSDPDTGLAPGLVRFIVIERLNGLMVATPRAEYLARVRDWIKRLDRDTGAVGNRLFIYRVQNGKATELADVMNKLFEEKPSQVAPPQLAPGLEAVTIGETDTPENTTSKAPGGNKKPVPPSGSSAGEGISLNDGANVRIIADEANNALLIYAGTTDYRQILGALAQLDVTPLQVLIEVTIAEVTLNDDLEYGVEWFFNNKVGGSLTGIGTLDLGTAGLTALTPGFSYALQGSAGVVNAVLNLLATESNLSIISSPSLLVLNNQEASIQVGEEVPVSTQQQQSTTANSNIINSIEYRDTGVKLNVKPRINAGGLVTLDVEQETSIVPTANNADPLTPRIQTRKITSSVAVQSGDTIILGGLIQDNHNVSEAGIPGLHQLPLIGNLFGTTSDNQGRTELLVLITPRAISHRNSALQATEEYRRKLHSLIPKESWSMPPHAVSPGGTQTTPTSRPEAIQAPSQTEISSFSAEKESQATGKDNARSTRIYRVVAELPADRAQQEALLATVRNNGFPDAYRYQPEGGQPVLSLGAFKNVSNAQAIIPTTERLGLEGRVIALP